MTRSPEDCLGELVEFISTAHQNITSETKLLEKSEEDGSKGLAPPDELIERLEADSLEMDRLVRIFLTSSVNTGLYRTGRILVPQGVKNFSTPYMGSYANGLTKYVSGEDSLIDTAILIDDNLARNCYISTLKGEGINNSICSAFETIKRLGLSSGSYIFETAVDGHKLGVMVNLKREDNISLKYKNIPIGETQLKHFYEGLEGVEFSGKENLPAPNPVMAFTFSDDSRRFLDYLDKGNFQAYENGCVIKKYAL